MNDEINEVLDRYAVWRDRRDDQISYEEQHGEGTFPDDWDLDVDGGLLADEMARLLCDLIGRRRIYSIHEGGLQHP